MHSKLRAVSSLVYSSEQGKMCLACQKPASSCICTHKKATPAAGDGVVRISRQTEGRKGVSLATGLPLSGETLQSLARQLKQSCGAGDAVKDGVIEIQGDHRETLAREFARLGYKAKLAGG